MTTTDTVGPDFGQALADLPDGNVLLFSQDCKELAVCTHATFQAMQHELAELRSIRDKLMAPTTAMLN